MDWLSVTRRLFTLYLFLAIFLLAFITTDWTVSTGSLKKQLTLRKPSRYLKELREPPSPFKAEADSALTSGGNATATGAADRRLFTSPASDAAPSPSESSFFEYYSRLMEERRNLSESQCRPEDKTNQYGPAGFSLREVIYMKKENIVWCPIFKAGSTSWIDYLFTDISLAAKVQYIFLYLRGMQHNNHNN